jgi:threonylcarbamoyladenosine tRNA methylthiotransferase MtaB
LAQPEIITFGCRLNAFESEVMRGHARAAGLAGAVIVNTCAVTAEAERQARQAIRRARRERPEAQIIVTGCAAQIDPDSYAAMAEVDRVLGNEEKLKAESFAPQAAARIAVDDIMTVEETTGHLIEGFEGRTRAFVQVQQGCDHRCTFCVIPFGRGNSRSVPVGEVVRRAGPDWDNWRAGCSPWCPGCDASGSPRSIRSSWTTSCYACWPGRSGSCRTCTSRCSRATT